jgi:hypothetical protein
MSNVRVLRGNPAVSDDDLAGALMSATDLDADEAFALVRALYDCPTELGGEGMQQPMLQRIAAVLRSKGFEVVYEP